MNYRKDRNNKVKNIIGWLLTTLLSLIIILSVFIKFTGREVVIRTAFNWGFSYGVFKILGALELIFLLLFIFPKTGVLGTLLLSAYVGGAIATLLEHNQSFIYPLLFELLIWSAALIRFPELSTRFRNN